jgi:hypothetical protein
MQPWIKWRVRSRFCWKKKGALNSQVSNTLILNLKSLRRASRNESTWRRFDANFTTSNDVVLGILTFIFFLFGSFYNLSYLPFYNVI